MIGQDDFASAIKECVTRWPPLEKQLDVYYSHLNFIRLDAFEGICHRFVEDFRSMPLPKDFKEAYSEWREKRSFSEPKTTGGDNFKIHPGVNCRECGKMNVRCIEEPMGAELICQQCYTGLTATQIAGRYADLAKVMDPDSDFMPEWYERDPVPF